MDIHKVYKYFMSRFRPGRIKQLNVWFPLIDGAGRILDVGCTQAWWQMVSPENRNITVINLDTPQQELVLQAGYRFDVADESAPPYSGNE